MPGSGLPESFFRDEALTLPFNLSVVSGKVLSGLTLGETLHHCGSPEMGPVNQGMRGESYFIGMRSLGQQGHVPDVGGLLLLCCVDRDWAVTQCFTEEAFQAITDFNDLPNSLFACNVHQSVFEGEESKPKVSDLDLLCLLVLPSFLHLVPD
ncbi:hypothetical protein CB1_001402114 [Camelus ferus]|nr:hypothetical protein CB1_001402114 [Camelus ferus]